MSIDEERRAGREEEGRGETSRGEKRSRLEKR